MNIYRKFLAHRAKAPFQLLRFWPAYYFTMEKGICKGLPLAEPTDLHHAKEGDIVQVLRSEDGNTLYLYRVMSLEYMDGGDWGGVSNCRYNLQFHKVMAKDRYTEERRKASNGKARQVWVM